MHPTLFDIIKDRRSVRKYTQEAVSRQDVMTILEAGRWAPSGMDKQPYRYLTIFRGDERQQLLTEHTRHKSIISNAGALVVFCLDREKLYNPMKDYQGAGACIQNMLLAAHALGLGGLWVGEIVNQADGVLATLKLDPARYELMAVIALGHPAEQPKVKRQSLQSMLLEDF